MFILGNLKIRLGHVNLCFLDEDVDCFCSVLAHSETAYQRITTQFTTKTLKRIRNAAFDEEFEWPIAFPSLGIEIIVYRPSIMGIGAPRKLGHCTIKVDHIPESGKDFSMIGEIIPEGVETDVKGVLELAFAFHPDPHLLSEKEELRLLSMSPTHHMHRYKIFSSKGTLQKEDGRVADVPALAQDMAMAQAVGWVNEMRPFLHSVSINPSLATWTTSSGAVVVQCVAAVVYTLHTPDITDDSRVFSVD